MRVKPALRKKITITFTHWNYHTTAVLKKKWSGSNNLGKSSCRPQSLEKSSQWKLKTVNKKLEKLNISNSILDGKVLCEQVYDYLE